jgi:hypothetical protein
MSPNQGQTEAEKPEAAPEPESEVETVPEAEADNEEDGGGEVIASSADLLKHLEADPEWFDALKVPVKVDGKQSEVTIRDLVKNYQIGAAAEHRLEEAKAKAASVASEIAARKQELENQFAVAAALIKKAEEEIDRDVAGINWAQLREEDPANYAARKADIEERRRNVDKLKSDAIAAWQQQSKQAQEESARLLAEKLAEEHEALLAAIPAWKDEATRKNEKAALAKYLMENYRFSQEDIASAVDHRLVVLAHKARLYDESQSKIDTAKKRVSKVPKVLKTASAPETAPVKRDPVAILYGGKAAT